MTPRVTVIVPARNEAATIGECLRSILSQELEGGFEVVVADGSSSDGTAALARAAGALVVDNPAGTTPAGLNAALAAARGELVVRFDAHGRMPPGYLAASVRALDEEPGAVGAGGWIEATPTGPWGRATQAALASRFGIGNRRSWSRPGPGAGRRDVETFPLGSWPTAALRGAGGWDETLLRNQDYALNYRLRRGGGRLVFDPAIWSYYRPRESYRALVRQYWGYGRFKARTLSAAPGSLHPRQLAPVVLLLAVVTAPLPVGVAVLPRFLLALYVVLLAAVAIGARAGWRTAAALATIHLVWGAGLVVGLAGVAVRKAARPFRSSRSAHGAFKEA
jgi:glycosyltransferase involved in cell wall biosynthesis